MWIYDVIIEQHNGHYRASIPALPNMSAEGASRDEAVRNVKEAAQHFLAEVEVTTIQVDIPKRRYSTAKDWLESAGKFAVEEDVMLQHLEEIYAERRRQREEVEREIDRAGGLTK